MNGTAERTIVGSPRKGAPAQLRSVSWNEDGDSELDVPGTPRTPRTSTTPGKAVLFNPNYARFQGFRRDVVEVVAFMACCTASVVVYRRFGTACLSRLH